MAFTYEFKIKQMNTMDQGPNKDAVVRVSWEATGTNESGETGTFVGTTPFSAEDVAPAEFIPFDQLTQDIVVGWIKQAINKMPNYQNHIDLIVQKQIDDRKVKDPPLPWA